MSLVLTGNVEAVTSETVNPPNGGASFVSNEIVVLTGEGADIRVEKVRVGRDYLPADWPKQGDKNVSLNVVVSTWAGKNGSGYRLTAVGRAAAASHGARIAAAS